LVDDEQIVTMRPIVDSIPRETAPAVIDWQAMGPATVRMLAQQKDGADQGTSVAPYDPTEDRPARLADPHQTSTTKPLDHVARLALARALATDGQVDEALVHYARLLQERRNVPDVRRDLYLLHEKHPQHQGVSDLRSGSDSSRATDPEL